MNASDIGAARTAAVAATIERVRAIEWNQGVTRPAFDAIKVEMLALEKLDNRMGNDMKTGAAIQYSANFMQPTATVQS